MNWRCRIFGHRWRVMAAMEHRRHFDCWRCHAKTTTILGAWPSRWDHG